MLRTLVAYKAELCENVTSFSDGRFVSFLDFDFYESNKRAVSSNIKKCLPLFTAGSSSLKNNPLC